MFNTKPRNSTPRVLRWDVILHDTKRGNMAYHCYSLSAVETMKDSLKAKYPKYAVTVDEVQ